MRIPLRRLWKQRRWAVYAGLLLCSVLAVIFWGVLPRGRQGVVLWSEWKVKRMRTERRDTPAKRIQALERRLAGLKERYASEALHLPGSGEMSVTIAALQEAAALHSVRVMEMRPGALQRRPTHGIRPVDVRLQGTFEAVASFLHAVERGPHVMKLQDLWLARRPADTEKMENRKAPLLHARVLLRVISAAEQGRWQQLLSGGAASGRSSPDSLAQATSP